MATQTPVPSRAAIHALRGLLFTTSCSVALLAEERRRRLKTVKTAAENARKIHAAKVLRGAPSVDGLQPWEASLRERALERHDSNWNSDVAVSPRDVKRGIRRRKKRPTRREPTGSGAGEASEIAAPPPTASSTNAGLAVRPYSSASAEQLKRLRPFSRNMTTAQHPHSPDRMAPEHFERLFHSSTFQSTNGPSADLEGHHASSHLDVRRKDRYRMTPEAREAKSRALATHALRSATMHPAARETAPSTRLDLEVVNKMLERLGDLNLTPRRPKYLPLTSRFKKIDVQRDWTSRPSKRHTGTASSSQDDHQLLARLSELFLAQEIPHSTEDVRRYQEIGSKTLILLLDALYEGHDSRFCLWVLNISAQLKASNLTRNSELLQSVRGKAFELLKSLDNVSRSEEHYHELVAMLCLPGESDWLGAQTDLVRWVLQPAKATRFLGLEVMIKCWHEKAPEDNLLHERLRLLLDIADSLDPECGAKSKRALRRILFRHGFRNSLANLSPDMVRMIGSKFLTADHIASGNPGAINLLMDWTFHSKVHHAPQDARLSELWAIREAREGNWAALLQCVEKQRLIEIAPMLLRTIPLARHDPSVMDVVAVLIEDGAYQPQAWDYVLLELLAIKEARRKNWDAVLPALRRARKASAGTAHVNLAVEPGEGNVRPGFGGSAPIIADLFVADQPPEAHATFLCELWTIDHFRMRPGWMEPALQHFGERRQLAEYLQWLDFGMSTDAQIDHKFATTLRRSLTHHWRASNATIDSSLQSVLDELTAWDRRAKHWPVKISGPETEVGRNMFFAAQRKDWKAVVEAYLHSREQDLPFNLGWLRWAVVARLKLEGMHSVEAENLVKGARAEGHDVSELEDWLPTYRLRGGWHGLSLFDNTEKNGFHLSRPVYNSAIRKMVEKRNYHKAWDLLCADAKQHGEGCLAYDEHNMANMLEILFALDDPKLYVHLEVLLENFISTRLWWHSSNMCRNTLRLHYKRLARSERAETSEGQQLLGLLSRAYDHVKEVRQLDAGFDGPGRIVTEVKRIMERGDRESESTAESPRRRPWFAASFRKKHLAAPRGRAPEAEAQLSDTLSHTVSKSADESPDESPDMSANESAGEGVGRYAEKGEQIAIAQPGRGDNAQKGTEVASLPLSSSSRFYGEAEPTYRRMAAMA